jgi:hypothetical protein
MKRWKVLRWHDRPDRTREIEFDCLFGCGQTAALEVSACGLIEAQIGMQVIEDPCDEPVSMPDEIECPYCRRIFGRQSATDVRQAV